MSPTSLRRARSAAPSPAASPSPGRIRSLPLRLPLCPPDVPGALPLRLPARLLHQRCPVVIQEPLVVVLGDLGVEMVAALPQFHQQPPLLPGPARIEEGLAKGVGAGPLLELLPGVLAEE